MEKPTLAQKLSRRKLHAPPPVIYPVLVSVMRLLYEKKLRMAFTREVDVKAIKGPFIAVGNHASRLDYLYASMVLYPHRLNYVAGYNEFFRSHLAFIFRLMQVIPKRNFVPDPYAVKQMSRILARGGKVMLFPEGMSSISGSNQPCAAGSGKLLKHYGVPVYRVLISGGYLTSTKYCLDERPGRVEVTLSPLFSPEDLTRMTGEEIQLKLDEAIHHDDYAWNRQARAAFRGNGRMAHNLHTLLFWCPRCNREFTMRGEGNAIRCTHCGNGATLDETYALTPLDEGCVIPETPRAWFDLQRRHVYRAVLDKGFELRERVRLGVLPKYEYLKDQATSLLVGEGELTLNRSGFSYAGTREGKPFSFHVAPPCLPTFGMCTDVSRFYTFVDNEFLEFFPETACVERWFMAAEEIHRLEGGAWRNFPDADTYREDNKQ